MIQPTAGEITLNGKRIDGMESYHIAKLGLAHSPEGRRVFATMTVTDNLGRTRRGVTTEGLYNNMCREYAFDTGKNTIYTSSYAVVHLIDGALMYDEEQMEKYE